MNALRWALRIFVVLLVGMSSMLLTMRFAIHGRELATPKFVGLSAQEANKLADNTGLTLVLENRFFNNDIAEGHILSQVPQPGVKVRRGWRVRVAESMGPQRIMVPSVLGDSPRAAELNLRRRGLELGTVAELPISGRDPGVVMAQSPTPDARGIASPKVSLLIAGAPEETAFVMPDLTGMKLEKAQATIASAGMKIGAVSKAPSQEDPASAANVVVHQTPAPGQRITAGSSINLEVSP